MSPIGSVLTRSSPSRMTSKILLLLDRADEVIG